MALAFQLFSKPAVAGITFESHTVKFTLIVLNFPAVAGINSFALIKPQIGKDRKKPSVRAFIREQKQLRGGF